MTEAEQNQGYVDYINSIQPVRYTYEELKAMGLPTYITPEGFITWE